MKCSSLAIKEFIKQLFDLLAVKFHTKSLGDMDDYIQKGMKNNAQA